MHGYQELREGAALIDLREKFGAIRVGGDDRARFLQGMLTADVLRLAPGEGCYAFQLDAKGHIVADLHVLCGDDAFLLLVGRALAAEVAGRLQRFLAAHRAEVLDVSAFVGVLAVEGPASAASVEQALGAAPPAVPWAHVERTLPCACTLACCSWSGQPGCWVIAGAGDLPALIERFALPAASAEAVETARIERGVARHGIDFGADCLPQETGLMHAVAFDKGCYRGQETVERIRSRGHVNRLLRGLLIESDEPPAPGAPVAAPQATRPVGAVTSAVRSPALGRTLALALLRREQSEPGTALSVGDAAAIVSALPFSDR